MVVRLKRKGRIGIGLLFLSFLVISANALSDSYIFMDSPDIPLCIAENNFSNYACNEQALKLDGTKDAFIYIVNNRPIPDNATTLQRLEYLAYTPFEMVIAMASFLSALILGVGLLYIILLLSGMIKTSGGSITKWKWV